MKFSKFSKLYIFIPFLVLSLVLILNIVVDPYSITKYNLLKIPNKFARDDRREKVEKLNKEPRYDNIIFGSSRVYITNPLTISKYLGGKTYNCGVGRSIIEDQLGFMLYLQRINKLPKNALFGLDFYSFNQIIETNKYFLQNDELNFLHKHNSSKNYFSKFLSVDAIRASYKTLHNFFDNSVDKPRFEDNGAYMNVSKIFGYYPPNITMLKFKESTVIADKNNIKTIHYNEVSRDRLNYVSQIVDICKNNDINCTFFTTPLNGQMLDEFSKDKSSKKSLITFKKELAKITPFYDFLYHNKIIDNKFFFGDTMHFTTEAGNLLYARLFHDKNISLPTNFGLYTPKSTE